MPNLGMTSLVIILSVSAPWSAEGSASTHLLNLSMKTVSVSFSSY